MQFERFYSLNDSVVGSYASQQEKLLSLLLKFESFFNDTLGD
jgi:hypothetical protein